MIVDNLNILSSQYCCSKFNQTNYNISLTAVRVKDISQQVFKWQYIIG